MARRSANPLPMDAGPAPASSPTAAASGQRRHCLRLPVLASLIVAALLAGAVLAVAVMQRTGWQSVTVIALLLCVVLGLLTRRVLRPVPSADTDAAVFQQLATAMPDAVVISDGRTLAYANPAAKRLLAIDTPAYAQRLANDIALAGCSDETPFPMSLRGRNDEVLQCSVIARPIRFAQTSCYLFVIHDLSEIERGRAALAVSNAELQAMAGRLFSLQEDERRSISRDLHDDIGQAITAIKLAACASRDETDTARRQDDIDQIIELADSTVTKLRNLSMLLRPPQLDALGLEAALRWQANMLFRSTPVELLLDVGNLPRRPSNEVEQACFRIAQESLTNALRHARASQVSLQLHADADSGLQLRVVDDGEGFDPDGPRGLGMIVMRERAQSAGGSLSIETAPGEGTRIDLHLPYAAAH